MTRAFTSFSPCTPTACAKYEFQKHLGGEIRSEKTRTGYHHPWYFCRVLEAGIRARETRRIAFPWIIHSGGTDAPALTYRCGGSTGIAPAGAHLFPVYPG